MSEQSPLHNLRWVRIFTPIHIPKYLVEQVKDRDFSVEKFYKFQEMNCSFEENGTFKLNPLNHLWVLVNPENITKGFVWFTVDPMGESLVLQTYSIDPEFWFQNKAVGKLAEFMKDFMKKAQMKRVFWISKYPKHQEKYGFRRSKNVLMEYTEEEENGKLSNGGLQSEEYRSPEPSTTTNSERDSK